MNRRRGIVVITSVLVVLLVLLAIAPFALRGPINRRINGAISNNIDAAVTWRDVDLGFFRSFPDLSLTLNGLTVVGHGAFARDTLMRVPTFRMALDLMSVLRGLNGNHAVVVRTIEVDRPRMNLIVLENGVANWSIYRTTGTSRRPGGLKVTLEELSIRNAGIRLENRQSALKAAVVGLNHTMRGDFSRQQFDFETRTTADSVSMELAGTPYLSRARISADVNVNANTATHTFVLRKNELRINALVLQAEGLVRTDSTSSDVDLKLNAPRSDFREILSLVPAIYAHDFGKLKTTGTMAASGTISGRLAKDAIPAFAFHATVNNGSFKYSDLPLPARDINVDLTLMNPGGSVDGTVLGVDRFHVLLGGDAIDGSLTMRTPKSDPDVDLRVAGRLDLANVPRTLKLDSVKELRGIVVANASMRARRSDVEQKRYERVSAAGTIEIQKMALNGAGLRQPLQIDAALLRLTPQHAELASFNGRAGSSDIEMTGELDNLLGFVLHHEVLRGTATVSSRHFNLDEWRSDDELKSIAVPGNIDFALRASADTVKYGLLTLRNAHGGVRIKDKRATLEDFHMDMLGGAATVTGYYETVDSLHPGFDADVAFNEIDIPSAFAGLRTIQLFAPVAQYAQGQFSAHMKLNGALGSNMMPLYAGLSALGSLVTKGLVLKSFPPLDALASATRLDLLRDPGFMDLKSSFTMEKGRLNVRPFDVKTGPLTMNVAGSNGIDQSLDYTVGLQLPNRSLGSVHVGGTVTRPALKLNLREVALNALKPVTEKVDSAAEQAKQKLIAEAEKRAAQIREEADTLAARMRREGHARADTLEARATGLRKIAAKLAAERLRKETDAKADALVREAGSRAQAIVDEARKHQ